MRGSYIIALAALALVGCKRDQNTITDPIESNLVLNANITVQPVNGTKITPSDENSGGVFELGDQLGLYIKPATPHATASGFHELNCNMLFNAQEVTTDGAAKNLFVPAVPVKYFQYELHKVFAYYPYQATSAPVSTTDASKLFLDFQIKDDQGKTTTINAKAFTNYSLSDLLWATKEDVKPQENAVVSVVALDFNHKMSNIVVKLSNSGGQPFVGVDAPEAALYNIERAAALNIETGAVSAPQAGKSSVGNSVMKPFTSYVNGTTTEMQYRATMPPQTINDKQALFRIRISGVNYEMVYTGSALTLEGGKQYVFNVKNSGVDFFMGACQVVDWDVIPDQNVTSPGDGLPHKLVFPFVDEITAPKVKSATLTIDGVDRTTVDVTYDAATKQPTLIYEMPTSYEDKLSGYKLYDVDKKLLKQASGLDLQILYNQTDDLFYFPVLDYTAQPANCYVAHSSCARIKFNALKKPIAKYAIGNAVPVNATGSNPSTAAADAGLENDITYAAGDVIEVAWQTAVNHATSGAMVIQSATLNADGTVAVNVNGPGNAVLSYKRGGVVLWNYHVWATSGDPFLTHCATGSPVNGKMAGGVQAQFMDRNLGALAATNVKPAAADAYKYFGMLYQHGRPMPFTGQGVETVVGTYTVIFDNAGAAIPAGTIGGYTLTKPAAHSVVTAIQNPNTYYTNGSSWYDFGNISLWSDYGTNKSVYDPCPYGYRVPKGGEGVASSWIGFSCSKWTANTIDGGTVWSNTWWPAAGRRNYNAGALENIGDHGRYWSSTPDTSGAFSSYDLIFDNGGDVLPNGGSSNCHGFAVRCVQEGY